VNRHLYAALGLLDVILLIAIGLGLLALVCHLCACGPGTLEGPVDTRGVLLQVDPEWLTVSEAEREESEAAELVAAQIGSSPAALLTSLSGVTAQEVGAIPDCGGVEAIGCTDWIREPDLHQWIRIVRTGECARYDAVYRHEIGHVLLRAATGDGDGGHTITRLWTQLDRQGDCK
jgi:hypothetical protein